MEMGVKYFIILILLSSHLSQALPRKACDIISPQDIKKICGSNTKIQTASKPNPNFCVVFYSANKSASAGIGVKVVVRPFSKTAELSYLRKVKKRHWSTVTGIGYNISYKSTPNIKKYYIQKGKTLLTVESVKSSRSQSICSIKQLKQLTQTLVKKAEAMGLTAEWVKKK